MSEPIFRYYDRFNDVYSRTSDRFKCLENFFRQYEDAKAAGNKVTLEQFIGRYDKDDNPLFAGDIIMVSYAYPGNEGQPGGMDPGHSGHFIGVIRYQPSKGFVMSRIIERVDAEDHEPNEYVKKPGAMQFSVSSTTKIGNINQHPELLKEGNE
jgi:uncharacterized phage protein (TIGR01671 family)